MDFGRVLIFATSLVASISCSNTQPVSSLAVSESSELDYTKKLCDLTSAAINRTSEIEFAGGGKIILLRTDICQTGSAGFALDGTTPAPTQPRQPLLIWAAQETDFLTTQSKSVLQQFKSAGYDVIDVRNQNGEQLKQSIEQLKLADPARFANNEVLLYVHGHGTPKVIDHRNPAVGSGAANPTGSGPVSVSGQGPAGRPVLEHHIAIPDENHDPENPESKPRESLAVSTRTGIILPVQDALGGKSVPLKAFVSSCYSGQVANDCKDDENLTVVASSAADQTSFAPIRNHGDLNEASGHLLAKMVIRGSAERKAADLNGDDAITAGEFKAYADKLRIGAATITKVETTISKPDSDPDYPELETKKVDGVKFDRQDVQVSGDSEAIVLPPYFVGKATARINEAKVGNFEDAKALARRLGDDTESKPIILSDPPSTNKVPASLEPAHINKPNPVEEDVTAQDEITVPDEPAVVVDPDADRPG